MAQVQRGIAPSSWKDSRWTGGPGVIAPRENTGDGAAGVAADSVRDQPLELVGAARLPEAAAAEPQRVHRNLLISCLFRGGWVFGAPSYSEGSDGARNVAVTAVGG